MSNKYILRYRPQEGGEWLSHSPASSSGSARTATHCIHTHTHTCTHACKTNTHTKRHIEGEWERETDREGENLGSDAVCLHKYRTSYSICAHIDICTHGPSVSAAAFTGTSPLHSHASKGALWNLKTRSVSCYRCIYLIHAVSTTKQRRGGGGPRWFFGPHNPVGGQTGGRKGVIFLVSALVFFSSDSSSSPKTTFNRRS